MLIKIKLGNMSATTDPEAFSKVQKKNDPDTFKEGFQTESQEHYLKSKKKEKEDKNKKTIPEKVQSEKK